MKKFKKVLKRIIWILTAIFIFVNTIAYFHAFKFTHFTENQIEKTKNLEELSALKKIKTLIFGINNPRPINKKVPSQKYETIKIKSNKEIAAWNIKNDSSKGTVILFHGFSGEKSSMIDKSDEFIKLGYRTLLIDFMGSGGSEGNQTTLGFFEAKQVKSCFDYIKNQGEDKIFLFGTSMGSVAIMKAINDYKISPDGIIIECPFGSMYSTVCSRFKNMNLPAFPMAGLLVFWGGIQNGFWAFKHNPARYSKNIICSTLLMYGEKDKNVTRKEIDEIFENLNGEKRLVLYPLAGHENYLLKYEEKWINDVKTFLCQQNELKQL